MSVAGDYTLTLTADPKCGDLPDEVRSRTFATRSCRRRSAMVRPGTSFTLLVSLGSPFLDNYRGFQIGVAGDYVAFSVYNGEDPCLVERIGPKTYLAFYGSAGGSVDAAGVSTISAPFDGGIEDCVSVGSGSDLRLHTSAGRSRAQCISKNHRSDV